MKALISLAAAAALTSPAFADCPYPSPPAKLPDGNSATMEEMVTAQKAVKSYNTEINEYLACLDKEQAQAESAAGGDKATDEQKQKIAKMKQVQAQKHNAAVDQAQSVADHFNEQVRIFKAKNAKS